MAEGWRERLDNISKNGISTLQEYATKRGFEVRYETFPSQGRFECHVYFEKFIASGSGKREKEAEEATADLALRSLYKNCGTNQFNEQPPNSPPEIIYTRQTPSASYSDEEEDNEHNSTHSDVAVETNSTSSRPVNDKNAGICLVGADPISILNEFAQKKGLELKFLDPDVSTAENGKIFTLCARLNNVLYPRASASTIKEAKREASRNALRQLKQTKLYRLTSGLPMFLISDREPLTIHDIIAKLCHEKFDNVVADIPDNLSGRKVIAGIVMENKTTKTLDVISIASGNRFITGDALTTDGYVLVDSHAEILAARGMRKFLYYHLTKLSKGEKSIVLQRIEGEQTKLAPCIKFHLFISTAPCGDGAIFTRSSGQSEIVYDSSHKPIFVNNKQGLLRTKIEQGEGQIPTKQFRESHQSMDNVRRGERLRVMSCSDKIGKWNLLGMQGALLATLMQPVYFSSITLGTLYNHGHIARAMCCRLEKSCRMSSLPDGYKVNHPLLGAVSRTKMPQRNVGKFTTLCINWNIAEKCAELTDGTTGVPTNSSRFARLKINSRLCKQKMLQSYKTICKNAGLLELVKDDYWATKHVSKRYQHCKRVLYESLHNQEYGTWVGLPKECQQFPTSSIDEFVDLYARHFTHSD